MMNFFDRVKGIFKGNDEDIEGGVFKSLGGGYWYAAYSNNFKDLDNEIISQAAHDRYVQRVKAGLVELPELWLEHTPGTRHGKAVMVDTLDHIVFAVGKFDDTPEGRSAEKYYTERGSKQFRLSHGFTYPLGAFKDGVYHDINTFEISVLEVGQATPANPFTSFVSIKELEDMPITDEKRAYYERVLGKEAADKVARLAESDERKAQKLAELGAAYKGFADVEALEAPAQETADMVINIEGLTELFEAMEFLMERQDKTEKAASGMATAVKARDEWQASVEAKIDAAIKQFNEVTAAVKALIEARPKSVNDLEGSVRDSEAEAQIEKQTTDPITGGGFWTAEELKVGGN